MLVSIFINQVREKIGVVFGNPETTTGGRALKFYSSVRIEVRRIGAIKDGDQVIGNRTKIKVVKNKVAAPFREVEVDILYGQGISREGDLLDLGATHEVVEKSGSWFSYAGERLGQGRDNARLFLKIYTDIRAGWGLGRAAEAGAHRDAAGKTVHARGDCQREVADGLASISTICSRMAVVS